MMSQRTIYLVDDNAEFRATAQWWLSGAGYDVRDFGDPAQALELLQRVANETPDALRHSCLLLDVRMPGMSGLDLHDRLAEAGLTRQIDDDRHIQQPGLPVVYMTGHGDVPLAVQAMQKGAVTFLEKPFADDALEAALQRAFALCEADWARAQAAALLAGREPERLDPGANERWGDSRPPSDGLATSEADDQARQEYLRRLESLSPRQREVFEGVVAGKLSKVIAYETGLSPKTVEFHRKQMMLKFHARTALELIRMAVAQRVMEPAATAN
jgi:two-component system, LuxR family, response regulator FixJ